MIKRFYNDLEIIYSLLKERQDELNGFYELLKETNPLLKDSSKEALLDNFISKIGLEVDKESRLAMITRLVNLREDSLNQLLLHKNFDKERIIEIKEEAYLFVASYYLDIFENFYDKIEQLNLLTPFYRAVIKGVHDVGVAFSRAQSSWNAQIVNGINRELFELFKGDEEKIFEMLNEEQLLDCGHYGEVADRCYSVLVKTDEGFVSIPYKEAFEAEVALILEALKGFKATLNQHDDTLFEQKKYYIEYIQAIIDAFSEHDTNALVGKWADVDRAWMEITTPLQIGHPLEYYEDNYRKAVALEWDLRIINPNLQQDSHTKNRIIEMYQSLFNKAPNELQNTNILNQSLRNLDRVQLYIGQPMAYYGAEFNGLFSAQVVPNDEIVSKEYGKKIFAFADFVYESAKAKPTMQISTEIFGKAQIEEFKTILEDKELWFKVYDITTIGHEFGHTLWMDEDSEAIMNASGSFKNVEEFKATTGGLITYYLNEEPQINQHIAYDTIKRAIGLIAWMRVTETLPYYIEGLLHLKILFDSGVISFRDRVYIDLSDANYAKMKALYFELYSDLVYNYYLRKRDPKGFLDKYIKKVDGAFLPLDNEIEKFVKHYYALYQSIGRVVDEN